MAIFNVFCLGTSHSLDHDEHLIVRLFNSINAFDLNNVITGQDQTESVKDKAVSMGDIQNEAQSVISELKKDNPDPKIHGEYDNGLLFIKENDITLLQMTVEDLRNRILFRKMPELKTGIIDAVKAAIEQNSDGHLKLIADGLAPKMHEDPKRVAQSKTIPLQAMYGIGLSDRARGISELLSADIIPDQVNLIGHGRGAVMCIQIAYFLSEIIRGKGNGIPCNLFVVDPVKQALESDPEKNKSLFMNVDINNFGCIFMEDANEDRYSFINVRLGEFPDAYLTENRPNLFVLLPGDHATATHITPYKVPDDKKVFPNFLPPDQSIGVPAFWPIGYATLQIILLWQQNLGVPLVNSSVLIDEKAICESLFQINRANPYYFQTELHEKANSALPVVPDSLARRVNDNDRILWTEKNKRIVALEKAGLLNPHRFSPCGFINSHHELIFKRAWPGLYDAVFDDEENDAETEEMLVEGQPYTRLFYNIMKADKNKAGFTIPGWLTE